MAFAWKAAGITYVNSLPTDLHALPAWPRANRFGTRRYNRYLAVAARVVRRSLKEDKRLAAERRGEMDLRMAKWEVRVSSGLMVGQFGWNLGRNSLLEGVWDM